MLLVTSINMTSPLDCSYKILAENHMCLEKDLWDSSGYLGSFLSKNWIILFNKCPVRATMCEAENWALSHS